MTALLSCSALHIAVHECVLVEALSLAFRAGTITAVLGRNGTGKSLTLRTLAGLRAHSQGTISLQGRELSSYSRRDIAKTLGYVAQDNDEPFPVTGIECAVSGRHPHLDFWQWESAEDYALARAALAAVDLPHCAERSVETLSGGERRRLAIATILTQAPRIYVLDEPTNHLDPQHQLQMLHLMRARADAGAAVIMSLHDPNLAMRFADDILMLFGDGRWLFGNRRDILTTEHLGRLYNIPMQTAEFGGQPYFFAADQIASHANP
jgi:iron complex transport system ATP-binding protein